MPTASELLLVQDDSGSLAAANSYADLDYFQAYCIMNGLSLNKTTAGTPAYTDDEQAVALMSGRRYMDTRWGSKYIGQRAQDTQKTEWPRYDAYDNSDFYINGITDIVRDAQCAYSYVALTSGLSLNPAPSRDETGQTVQRKTTQVGPILDSVTYVAGAAFSDPIYPEADNILKSRGYVTGGSSLIRS